MAECNYHYYPETNEAGWRCTDCDHRPGEPPGYSPQLDRKLIDFKVGAILMDACTANLIYVSNGSHGEFLAAKVADRCVREDRFDQYSILLYILEEMTQSHAEYWKGISDGVIAGKDPRDRCHCGQLAKMHIGKASYCSMAHSPEYGDLFATEVA